MSRVSFIYILTHPHTGVCHYVGKTVDPKWIKALRGTGLKPAMRVIQECRGDEWVEAERHWISHFQKSGVVLCNISRGGDGWPKEAVTREKIGRTAVRNGHIERLAAMKRGKKQSPEHLAKRIAACGLSDSKIQRERGKQSWKRRKRKAELDARFDLLINGADMDKVPP